jgi:hypothetical protein
MTGLSFPYGQARKTYTGRNSNFSFADVGPARYYLLEVFRKRSSAFCGYAAIVLFAARVWRGHTAAEPQEVGERHG